MTDPRERIETDRLLCVANSSGWTLTRQGPYAGAARAPWPELVAFAEKILAADEAWRDSQTPTLEKLRARYPGAMVAITPLHIPGDDYLARLVTEGGSVEYAGPTVGHALRWLAATLAEITKVEGREELTDGK